MIAPNSIIKILKCPIELDNENQLTFSTKQAQYNYFNSLTKIELEEATFQRKDNVLRFPTNETTLTFDDLIEYNYCMYQNTNYGDKWFYAFITNITYENDGLSLITLETDVFQTWQLDIEYKKCFVEREHLAKADDIVGANTIPENVELGDYVLNDRKKEILNDKNDYYICMSVTELPDASFPAYDTRNYNGIFSGLFYLAFSTPQNCNKAIQMYDKTGKADAINSLFIIPKNIESVQDGTTYTWQLSQGGSVVLECEVIYMSESSDADLISTDMTLTKPTKLGENYTPTNAKLLTFPYCYVNVANNVGATESFRYEDWKITNEQGVVTNEIAFWVVCSLSAGMNIKAFPLFYKNENYNYNYGIIGGKLPICSWSSDVYTNWLTQNALNIPLNMISSGLQIGGGIGLIGTGKGALAGGGQIASGMLGIASSISQIYQASLTPNQARGNTNGSEINFADDAGIFTLYPMSIKDEYAKIIDDYFTMYGYKTNRLKLPNLSTRSNFNYVKTIGCNIIGDIPQNDLQKIKDMYNNGVTLWHNSSTFLNYDVANN